MNTYSWYKSKTVWTFVALFIISGTNGVMNLIPAGDVIYVQGFLTFLGAFFHVDTAKALGGTN